MHQSGAYFEQKIRCYAKQVGLAGGGGEGGSA